MLIANEHHEGPVAETEEEPVGVVDLTPEYAPTLARDGTGWK